MRLCGFLVPCLTALIAGNALSDPRVLTTEEWHEDLEQLSGAILEGHPRPFHRGDRAVFEALIDSLESELKSLSDKEIIVRLAEIVAAVNDGHTRLSLPRQHPEIGLEFGHAGTPPPNSAELAFRQLPLAFEQFENGVYVVSASDNYANYIGARLDAVDGIPVDDVLRIAQRVTFSENSQLEKLMGADRLSMPEVLAALGISSTGDRTELTLHTADGQTQLVTKPIPDGEVNWVRGTESVRSALRNKFPEKKFWYEYLPEGNVVYAQINEIADDEMKLAQFVTQTVAEAEKRKAKLVIDLRSNFGGRGGLNRTLELALIQSEDLNQYGRTFVLTGRRTFSAAQMLVNVLEKYTRVLFVGEPTGARTDHYGDSRKTRLTHSGLTLRVSSLHWSSLQGGDTREALNPDLPAPWTSMAYFSGSDPALETVKSYQGDINSLLTGAFERNDEYQVVRYLTHSTLAPDTYSIDLSKTLVDVGQSFAAKENTGIASLVYRYGLYFFPGDKDLESALRRLSED